MDHFPPLKLSEDNIVFYKVHELVMEASFTSIHTAGSMKIHDDKIKTAHLVLYHFFLFSDNCWLFLDSKYENNCD